VDFFNIMTYDLMNRRDNITKHHTGIQLSLESIDAYLSRGISPSKMNLGFAFYVKWFRTDPTVSGHESCLNNPIGCKTALMEDPDTGDDLGQSGAFSWHDEVPSTLAQSFSKAKHNGAYDETGGGYYYWDEEENIWWTFDTPEAMKKKFEAIVKKKGLAGVFAWALGEDADDWKHLKAVNEGVEGMSGRGKEAQEHMEL
jgi:GH18 family chitinase